MGKKNVLELMEESEELLKKKKKIKIARNIIISLMIVAFVLLLVCLIMTPKINLKDSKEITLKYPEKYNEPGYTAEILNGDITDKVEVRGKVDYSKPGTYKITYIAKNFIFKTEVVRIVKIVDDEAPKIVLKGLENTNVCPNTKYKEEGFTVTDNFDKNLEENVEIEEKENQIIYTVKDSSGNKTKVIRNLTYKDAAKPEIKLKGYNPTYLFLGSKYEEAGYTATDNCDGDISKNVKVSGSVNANAAGKYTLTYTVSDTAGNETSVKREVVVEAMKQTSSGCGIAGAIYLTFDDGPGAVTTAQILDVLKEEGVKATFFVTNHGPDSLIKRAYNEGHTIGLHTASHNYATVYASVDAYFKDLNSVSSRVKRITGYESKFIRFPGGSSNLVSKKYTPGIMTTLTKEVVNKGYKYYDWNVSSEDAGSCASTRTANCVYNHTVNSLSKNKCNMVLMHDVKQYTANAVRDIIKYGKKNGYIFKAIDMGTPMVKQKVNN